MVMTRLAGIGCVLLAAGGLTGCAHLEPVPVAGSPKHFAARSLDDPGLKMFLERNLGRRLETWPLPAWDFPELALAACYFNPTAQAAQAQWQTAEAAATTVASLPRARDRAIGREVVGALATITPDADPSATPSLSPSRLQIDPHSAKNTAHRSSQRTVQARYQARLLRLHAAAVMWQVRANLRTNLLGFVTAQRRQELWSDLEAVQMELTQAARQTLSPDKTLPIELSLLQLQLAQTRLQLILALGDKVVFRQRLADSLGLPPRALLQTTLTYDFSRAPAILPDARDLRRMALQGRSDVLRAVADYNAAEDSLRLALGQRGADPRFQPGCSWDALKNRWTVNLSLKPSLEAAQDAAGRGEMRRIAAAARLLNLQTEVLDELEERAAVYRSLLENAAVIDRLTASIGRLHDSVEARCKVGTARRIELLLVKLQLLPAELAQRDAQAELQSALGSLEDAVQQPIEAFCSKFPALRDSENSDVATNGDDYD